MTKKLTSTFTFCLERGTPKVPQRNVDLTRRVYYFYRSLSSWWSRQDSFRVNEQEPTVFCRTGTVIQWIGLDFPLLCKAGWGPNVVSDQNDKNTMTGSQFRFQRSYQDSIRHATSTHSNPSSKLQAQQRTSIIQ